VPLPHHTGEGRQDLGLAQANAKLFELGFGLADLSAGQVRLSLGDLGAGFRLLQLLGGDDPLLSKVLELGELDLPPGELGLALGERGSGHLQGGFGPPNLLADFVVFEAGHGLTRPHPVTPVDSDLCQPPTDFGHHFDALPGAEGAHQGDPFINRGGLHNGGLDELRPFARAAARAGTPGEARVSAKRLLIKTVRQETSHGDAKGPYRSPFHLLQ
jgi:hypothetical protein